VPHVVPASGPLPRPGPRNAGRHHLRLSQVPVIRAA
jgi:hypothetical protein